MTSENRNIPDWAHQERESDLGWIRENLDVFWTVSGLAFEDAGRGAIYVDTTIEPIPGAGHPFGYFPQEQAQELYNDDTRRMVSEYDPTHELVLVLLKPYGHTSTYRIRAASPELEAEAPNAALPRDRTEAAVELRLEPPDVETLIQWEAEGGCEAACPHGCWVEPDGVCSHGNPSWLLRLGLI